MKATAKAKSTTEFLKQENGLLSFSITVKQHKTICTQIFLKILDFL